MSGSLNSLLQSELDALSQQNRLRVPSEFSPLPGGARCLLNGRPLWNFGANDYLGLADHASLIQAATVAMQEFGIGSRASALVTGRTQWHARLEAKLAAFKHAEAAILFPSGFAANVATITSLVDHRDVILCDRLNHASLIDGSKLSKAKLKIIAHNNVDDCRKQLMRCGEYRRRLIVIDSIFSMDGDHAALDQLAALADEFNAILLVDEAHATGVCGPRGTGLLEAQGVTSENVISVGTLSKALGAQGGFVTGSQTLISWLWNAGRMQMYSTALSTPICAAAIAAIELVEAEPQRRQWLDRASMLVIRELRDMGWNVPDTARGPIVPILIGDDGQVMKLAKILQEHGIFVAAIRPPTVPHGTARLRISLSYAHQDEGVQYLLSVMKILKSDNALI